MQSNSLEGIFVEQDLQYTQYLDSMRSYTERNQADKALILIGYVERDFIRFYRAGRVEEGIQFAQENLARSKSLLNKLKPEEKVAQLHAWSIFCHSKVFKIMSRFMILFNYEQSTMKNWLVYQ